MTVNGVTTQFGYGTVYPDRLTSYNGKAIIYNSMGCPTSYGNKTLTWSRGKLSGIAESSGVDFNAPSDSYAFSYNAKGQRVIKTYTCHPGAQALTDYMTDSNTVFAYDNAGRLIHEKRVENYKQGYSYTREFVYLYDESGMIGFTYSYNSGTPQTYYYQRNLLGDVVAIYNRRGVKQAEYAYDAWGNCTITNSTNADVANSNTIRYRGYYYDKETNLYYLDARYYNPEWRRFISPANVSASNPQTVNGLNLYVYSENNPINIISVNINQNLSSSRLEGYAYLDLFDVEWHWKNEWFVTDWPHFFVLSKDGFAVVDWGLTVYRGSLFFDSSEQYSVYNESLNISIYAGRDFKKKKWGIELGGSVGRVGFDGRFIDIYVDFLTVKFFFIYKNGKFKPDIGSGVIDVGFAINIAEIIEYIKERW